MYSLRASSLLIGEVSKFVETGDCPSKNKNNVVGNHETHNRASLR